jgi:hypothetical protein
MEVWKNFEFCGMFYSVSSLGRIFSYDRDEYLPQWDNTDGYSSCKLGKGKTSKTVRVHRIVAENFVHNPDPKKYNEVNHLDFDRKNNSVENLEWCTHKENVYHSINAGRMNYQINDYSGKNNPNYGNRSLSEKYKKDLDYAKEKQGRPGTENGRCIPIAMISENGFYKEFEYVALCAKYLLDSKLSDAKSIAGVQSNLSIAISKNKKYLGFNFIKI